MIQQISYFISKAGIVSAAGKTEDQRRRLSDMPTPAAFVSYAPNLPALVGWYGYRVAFNGVGRVQLEAALDSLRRHFRLRDVREWYDRYSGFYIVEALFAVRMNLPGGVFGGAQPTPEPDALNFYMPAGGTISLNKVGSPTVVELEYSIDRGATWTVWQPDNNGNRSLTLTAWQRVYIRNTSETQTGFSTSGTDYYKFSFVRTVEASGNCNSLLCKIPNIVTTLTDSCFRGLFESCTSLKLSNGFTLPATTLGNSCYRAMFYNCTSLTLPNGFRLPSTTLYAACYAYMFYNCTSLTWYDGFTLPATTLANYCYTYMFANCIHLNTINTSMTDISATDCLTNWLGGVSPTGDFYCDQNLTIPTGASGIPSGWTRHDI